MQHRHQFRPAAIEASGLRKSFGDVTALDGLDLVAPGGAVTAVLGPNGAGKTTFVRTVATLTSADEGSLYVAGIDAVARPDEVRRVIGLAGQHAAVEPALTGRENLVMVARLFGHRRADARRAADAVLAQLGLSDDGDRLVRQYSGGMRRRLDLGASLVGTPRLLLLDEPTTGLDPRSRIELWDAIRALVRGGTDVLLTTQYLEEADQLADHVVIVDHGRAIATGTPDELKALAGRDVVEIRVRRRRRPGSRGRVAVATRERGAADRRLGAAGGRARRRRHRPARRRGAPARRRPRRARRCRPAPADARRGLPRPHRSPGGRRPLNRRTRRRLNKEHHDHRHLHAAPTHPAGVVDTATTVAGRTLRQFVRTPQLLVVGALTSTMFLLIFRYVFGGAIGTGDVAYVDFLIPGLAAAGAMFSGTGAAVGVAEDVDSGLFDRLRSLPIPRSAVLIGRSMADTALVGWGLFITVGVGILTGFRFHGSAADAVLAVGLCVLYGAAFTWPFIWMGLVSGSAQAAQGMSMLAFPFVFVSSAYVPVESMPGWMQPIAEHQPITPMVGSVRALALGDQAEAALGHSAGWFAVRAVAWCVVIVAVFLPLATRKFARR